MKTQRTVLITGGSSGIGFALAKKFLSAGDRVIVTGRNLSKLNKVHKEFPNIQVLQSDVTKRSDVQTLVEVIQDQFDGVDVLINNAGIMNLMDASDAGNNVEKMMEEIEINVNSPIRLLHYFLPQLKASPHAIVVNVSSGLAYVPYSQAPVYSGTKAALHAWSRAIRPQLKLHRIKVVELLPPVVDTPLAHGANLDQDKFLKPMPPEKMADIFWKKFTKGKEEILPGISNPLKKISKIAPKFLFNQLNKQPIPERKKDE